MTNETEILSEADEIAALLPWYVTGKISAVDKARVDAYARANPEVQRHIALAREEADSVFTANSEIHVPHRALDKLIESIEQSPSVRLSSMKASFLDTAGAWLAALAPRQLAYAALAAMLLLAVQAGAIGSLLQAPAGGYQTASHSDAVGVGTFALVGFQPAAPQATLTSFLADNKIAIVDGPKAGGLYRVRISDSVLDKATTDALIAKLKARADLVSFASAAPSNP